VNLDNAITLLGIAAESALLGTLLVRRAWRLFPVFTLNILWSLAGDLGATAIYRCFPSVYATAYLIDIAIGSLLEFGVLVELAWSTMRPFRAALPRATPFALAACIVLLGTAIWPLTGLSGLSHRCLQYCLIVRLGRDSSILRVLCLAALLRGNQLLPLGWSGRQRQIVTGFSFYALVTFVVEMICSHLALNPLFAHLNRISIAGYICALLYWTFSFARKEPDSRLLPRPVTDPAGAEAWAHALKRSIWAPHWIRHIDLECRL